MASHAVSGQHADSLRAACRWLAGRGTALSSTFVSRTPRCEPESSASSIGVDGILSNKRAATEQSVSMKRRSKREGRASHVRITVVQHTTLPQCSLWRVAWGGGSKQGLHRGTCQWCSSFGTVRKSPGAMPHTVQAQLFKKKTFFVLLRNAWPTPYRTPLRGSNQLIVYSTP